MSYPHGMAHNDEIGLYLPVRVTKKKHESKTANTNRAPDLELAVWVEENSEYTFESKIYGFMEATPDIKFVYSIPSVNAGGSSFGMYRNLVNAAITHTGFDGLPTEQVLNATGFTRFMHEASLFLHIGPSAGWVTFDWAQSTSGNPTMVFAGSWIQVTKCKNAEY